jgi:hypothetical protein
VTENDEAIFKFIKEIARKYKDNLESKIKTEREDWSPRTIENLFGVPRTTVERKVDIRKNTGVDCGKALIGLTELGFLMAQTQTKSKYQFLQKHAKELFFGQLYLQNNLEISFDNNVRKDVKDAGLGFITATQIFTTITSIYKLNQIVIEFKNLKNTRLNSKKLYVLVDDVLKDEAIEALKTVFGLDFEHHFDVQLFVPTYEIFADIIAVYNNNAWSGIISIDNENYYQITEVLAHIIESEINELNDCIFALPKSPVTRKMLHMLELSTEISVDIKAQIMTITEQQYETQICESPVNQEILNILIPEIENRLKINLKISQITDELQVTNEYLTLYCEK